MSKSFFLYLTIFAGSLVVFSCQTIDTNIPENSTPEVYFQKAQAASDQSDYTSALTIYEKFLATGIDDSEHHRLSAQYEVALLHLKKGEKEKAIALFRSVLSEYSDTTAAASLPAWIRVLTQKKLQELVPPAPLILQP